MLDKMPKSQYELSLKILEEAKKLSPAGLITVIYSLLEEAVRQVPHKTFPDAIYDLVAIHVKLKNPFCKAYDASKIN